METKKEVNDIAYRIVGCAIEVHRHLGPGLLESVYEQCLIDELVVQNGLHVQSQFYLPLFYIKLADKPKGLLINFNCENITSQLVSLVTEKFAQLP